MAASSVSPPEARVLTGFSQSIFRDRPANHRFAVSYRVGLLRMYDFDAGRIAGYEIFQCGRLLVIKDGG